jgi:hypothetical protein
MPFTLVPTGTAKLRVLDSEGARHLFPWSHFLRARFEDRPTHRDQVLEIVMSAGTITVRGRHLETEFEALSEPLPVEQYRLDFIWPDDPAKRMEGQPFCIEVMVKLVGGT